MAQDQKLISLIVGDEDDSKLLLWDSAMKLKEEPVDSSAFLVVVKQNIEEGNAAGVYYLVTNQDLQELLQFVGWELVGILIPYLDGTVDGAMDGAVESQYCEKILFHICKVCSPKEVILGITENIGRVTGLQGFFSLLRVLQKALLRQTSKQSKFMKMAFEQILFQLKRFTECDNDQYEEHEVQAREQNSEKDEDNFGDINTKEKGGLCCLIHNIMEFSEVFINNIMEADCNSCEYLKWNDYKNYTKNEESSKIWILLLIFFSNILDYPLSWIDISQVKRKKKENCLHCQKSIIECSNEILDAISSRLKASFVDFLTLETLCKTSHSEDEDLNVSSAGLATFAYMILVEHQRLHFFPCVLRSEYLLSLLLQPICAMLERSNPWCVHKGLALLEEVTTRLPDSVLPTQFLDHDKCFKIPETLINVMIWCQNKNLRKKSVRLLPWFIKIFTPIGRYRLLRHLLVITTHPGVISVLIQCVKDETDKMLSMANPDEDDVFCGDSLFVLLRLIMEPIKEKELDILKESDRIVTILNLIRFLLLRDSKDKTGIWKDMRELEREYFSILRTAINITRIQHQLTLQEKMQSEKQTENNLVDEEEPFISVTTSNGTPISHLPPEQQLQILRCGLNTLDVIESVLARVAEIVSGKR